MHKLILLATLATLSFAAPSTAIVTKIVDGDTIYVTINGTKEKIRVLYIDTPEKNGGAKLEKDASRAGISASDEVELGKLATGYATRFFRVGDTVVLNYNSKDRNGRILATVSKNGVDYSKKIVEDGYSCVYKKAPYPKELDNVLLSAKESKKGLWSVDYGVMSKLCR